MSTNTKLSLVTCYYIHKLLRRHAHELKSVLASGAGLDATAEPDLNEVLESLYLDELEISENVRKLEVFVRWHETLANDKATNFQQLAEVERQIFWILGLKKIKNPEKQEHIDSHISQSPLISGTRLSTRR